LRRLELERNTLLRQEEEKWRLRSRALWLASGDRNTNFFHNVASRNRNKNFIWDIKGENNMLVNDQALLKKEAAYDYIFFYKTSCSEDTVKQCKLADLFP